MVGAISEHTFLLPIKAHSAAGTATITSDAVDMALYGGFDAVRLFCRFGTAASNNVIKAQQSSDDGSTDGYSDIADSSVSSGSSDELVWLDIVKPGKRYLKLLATPGTSSTVETMYAELYKPRVLPVDNTISGTTVGEISVSPAEGTA